MREGSFESAKMNVSEGECRVGLFLRLCSDGEFIGVLIRGENESIVYILD